MVVSNSRYIAMFYFEDTQKPIKPERAEENRIIFDGTARLDFSDEEPEIEKEKNIFKALFQYVRKII